MHLSIMIYCYQDVCYCIGLGAVLTQAEHIYNKEDAEWPPKMEATNMIIQGVSICIVHIIFWSKVMANSCHYDCGMH